MGLRSKMMSFQNEEKKKVFQIVQFFSKINHVNRFTSLTISFEGSILVQRSISSKV